MLKRLLTVSRTQVYSYCLALQLSFVRCCFTSFSARSFTALGLIPSMRGQASQRFLDTVSQLPEVTGRRNMSSSATTWRNNTRSSVTLNFRHGLLPGLIGEEGPTSASMVEIYIPEDKRKRHFNTAGGNYLCTKWKKTFVAWLQCTRTCKLDSYRLTSQTLFTRDSGVRNCAGNESAKSDSWRTRVVLVLRLAKPL